MIIRKLPKTDQVILAAKKGKTVSPQKGKIALNEAGPDLTLLIGVSSEMPAGVAPLCPKLKALLKEANKVGARLIVIDVGACASQLVGKLKFDGVGRQPGELAESCEAAEIAAETSRSDKQTLKKRKRLMNKEIDIQEALRLNKKQQADL